MDDKDFMAIVPNFVGMEKKYEGLIKDFADEIETLDVMRDSLEMHDQKSVYMLAVGNATTLKRKLVSDLADLRTIYRTKLNEKRLLKPLDHSDLTNAKPHLDFTSPWTMPDVDVPSVDVELPKKGGFQAEIFTIPHYHYSPDPTYANRPRAFTPADLYKDAGVMLEFCLPIVKDIAKHYHNDPPLLRFEKHLSAASQILREGLITANAFERFGQVRSILKKKFYINL